MGREFWFQVSTLKLKTTSKEGILIFILENKLMDKIENVAHKYQYIINMYNFLINMDY